MRAIMLLALLALLAFPVASAAKPLPVVADPYVEVSGDCQTCVEADLTAYTVEPDGCADCGGLGVHAGVEYDGQNVHVDAVACRGGFVVICFVDQRVTV